MMTLARICVAAYAVAWVSSGLLLAQTGGASSMGGITLSPNISSASSPYFGSVTTAPPTGGTVQLSLNEAIHRGVEHNLALIEARAQEKIVRGQTLQSLQPLLPKVTAGADAGVHQINLAAEGFSPGVLAEVSRLFPNIDFSGTSLVTKVDRADASVDYSQTLFDLSSIDRYRAGRAQNSAAYFATQSSLGLVILQVGKSYLETLAARSRVDDAKALLASDQLVLNQSVARHQAGVAAKLDVLRARVAFQSQQQRVIVAEDDLAKAKITLNREIGLPPEQKIQLTDAVPYAALQTMPIAEARRVAYRSRQDYQRMLKQIRAAEMERDAAKWERLPSLHFHGEYGVTGVIHGLYHGTFVAEGSIQVPIFQEAKMRGDREAAEAKLASLEDRFADLKQEIDQQLRDSLLDVGSTGEITRVAQSNVNLAQQALQQATERFAAGVDDTLPVVEAQATLASAQSSLIDSTVRYNEAKLGLARNLGIVETAYSAYLDGK